LAFVRTLARLRAEHPVLRRRTFYQGRPLRGAGIQDVNWFTPAGEDVTDGDWEADARRLGMRLAGDLMDETDEYGRPVSGDTLFVILNAGPPVSFTLPPTDSKHRWELLVDTAHDHPPRVALGGGQAYPVEGHSLVLFVTRSHPPGHSR
jgi:glycogen operon protein